MTVTGRQEPADASVTWRKSSRSGTSGACVEIAEMTAAVGMRDSKDVTGPVLVFSRATFAGFIAGVQAGEFDLPA
jgi:hypothetical protein